MASASEEFFDFFTRSAFRLETLPQYLGTSDPAFRAFERTGELLPLTQRPSKQEWMRLVAKAATEGKRLSRVHVVDLPLTPYLRYEMAAYPENAEAGEEIHIADRGEHPELGPLTRDFWLLDIETDRPSALVMEYDREGRFLGDELTSDPSVIARCRHHRDLALACSVPLDEFMAAIRG